MSDEFIEQRSLRMRRAEPQTGEHVDTSEPPDPMTEELPFVVLEPPPEAGVSVSKRDDPPTLHPPPDAIPQTPDAEIEPEPWEPRFKRGADDPRPEPEGESVMRLPRIEGEPQPLKRAQVRVSRPEHTGPADPVEAELYQTSDQPAVPPGAKPLRRAAPDPKKKKSAPAWGVQQVLLLVLFVAITLLIVFVPGALAMLGERRAAIATDVPPAPTPTTAATLAASPSALPAVAADEPELELVFSANLDGDFDLYLLSDGIITPLIDSPANETSPAWSPDGERIVFVSDEAGNDDLYLMAADGSGVTALTSTPAADRHPAWSPDGGSIIFTRESSEASALLVMRSDCLASPATCEEGLTTFADDRFYTAPTWSPDGTRVAAAAAEFPGLPSVIGIFGLAADAYTPLQGSGGTDITPAWGPDGTLIAFTALVEGTGYDIFTQTPTGDGLTALVTSEANDVEPAWAGGDQLVFASDRGETGDFDLYLCTLPACADPQPLTDNAADDLNPAVRP